MSTFTQAMRQFERDGKALFAGQAASIARVIREVGWRGQPLTNNDLAQIRRRVLPMVTAFYLGRDSGGDLAPYEVLDGRVRPLSPYMRWLWTYNERVTRVAVQKHEKVMRSKLKGADDLIRLFEMAAVNPIVYAKAQVQPVREMGIVGYVPIVEARNDPPPSQIFQPDPLAQYEPMHLFVWKTGTPYRLSDRIWRTSVSTRQRLDAVLQRGIALGKSSVELADDVEQFLQVGRVPKRTYKPYGERYMPAGGASYDAMRLARTEITAAHARADFVSANLNPFVYQYRRHTSNSRTEPCQICLDIEAGSPYAKSNPNFMPPSHPHCMCYVTWDTVPKVVAVGTLREEVVAGRDELTRLVGPMLAEKLVQFLLADATGQGVLF